MEAGGTIVALASSTEYLAEQLELPVRNALTRSASEFSCPGSLLRAHVTPGHPVTYGLPEELAVFRDLRRDIGFGLGVVDIKRTEIETADEVARRIERAEKVLGRGRVAYVHPDCGFWMLKRNIADGKMRALVAGRDLYEGLSPSRRAPGSRPGR